MLQPNQQNPSTPPSPETVLVGTGKIQHSNPDNTPMDERVSMVYRFKQVSERSNRWTDSVAMWKESDRLLKGNHCEGLDENLGDYEYAFVMHSIAEKLISLLIENIAETEIPPR